MQERTEMYAPLLQYQVQLWHAAQTIASDVRIVFHNSTCQILLTNMVMLSL